MTVSARPNHSHFSVNCPQKWLKMYLSLSLCAFQERGHSQREKALSWERKQFLYPLARVYLKRPHTQRHLECLSLSHSLSLRKSSSFSSSFREREKETYFFDLLVALSEPISFPYIFFHFKKVVLRAHTALSLSLAHTHTNSGFVWRWDDDILLLYFLRIHRSYSWEQRKKESAKSTGRFNFCMKTPNWCSKERKKLPLARKEQKEKERQKSKKKEKRAKSIHHSSRISHRWSDHTFFSRASLITQQHT